MQSNPWRQLPLAELLLEVERVAEAQYGGHYTILKFTTHYKACWHTPDLYVGRSHDRIRKLPHYDTLREALIALLTGPPEIFDVWNGA